MENNRIAFLDTEVTLKNDGRVKFKIYKKPTHTDQYLMFDSNHHIGQKLGIVNTLNYRIDTLVTEEEDADEAKKEVQTALKECRYPDWAVKRKKKEKENREDDENKTYGKVVLPYVKRTSEKITRTLKKYNIETIHKPSMKLKSMVCNMKDKVHPMDRTGAIYRTECKKHKTATYVGETDRALKARAYEHKIVSHKDSERSHSIAQKEKEIQPTRRSKRQSARKESENEEEKRPTRKSSRQTKKKDYKAMHTGEDIHLNEGQTEVSKHVATEEHDAGDVTIHTIDHDENWYTRGIREAIHIKKRRPTLNADEGRFNLNPIYDVILHPQNKEYKSSTHSTTQL